MSIKALVGRSILIGILTGTTLGIAMILLCEENWLRMGITAAIVATIGYFIGKTINTRIYDRTGRLLIKIVFIWGVFITSIFLCKVLLIIPSLCEIVIAVNIPFVIMILIPRGN